MFSECYFLQRHARLILLGLLLCMGAAMASPLVKPTSMVLVCTGASSVMLVVVDADSDPVQLLAMSLECSDCLPAVLPPQDKSACTIEKPMQGCITAVKLPLAINAHHCQSLPSRGTPIPVFPI